MKEKLDGTQGNGYQPLPTYGCVHDSMYKTYSESDLQDMIEAMIYELGSQKAVACKLGVSAAYLNDYLSGRRMAGSKILVALELRRVISYESTKR